MPTETADSSFDELFANEVTDWNDLVELEFAQLANQALGTNKQEDEANRKREANDAIGILEGDEALNNVVDEEQDAATENNEEDITNDQEIDSEIIPNEIPDRFELINITMYKFNHKRRFLDNNLRVETLLKNTLKHLTEHKPS